MAVARPRFNPSRCNAATDVDPLRLDGNDNEDITWTPLITCPADFPVALVCFLRPMRLLAVQLTHLNPPPSLNMPFHSSFIIRSTTRRSSFDPKSYKTPILSPGSPASFQPSKICSPSGTYTASSSPVAPHATRPSSSTARSTRLQILV